MRHGVGICAIPALILALLLSGCGGKTTQVDHSGEPRDNTARVLTPEASGETVYENEYAKLDASHVADGYVMAQYKGSAGKVKLQITGPDAAEYTYLMGDDGSMQTYPLTSGNGSYEILVLECVSGDSYAVALSQSIDVTVEDEFLPFLYPNEYCKFTADSAAVKQGEELAKDMYSDLEVVGSIYDWTISTITYDEEKAQSVEYGYVPSVDDTLESKTGICFDYAAIMACMLRSQGIPTKLQVGYSGEAYHAWISTYLDEAGWVDNIIEFDGKSWSLMDPTLAANNDAKSVEKYVGDGSNYVVKYSY